MAASLARLCAMGWYGAPTRVGFQTEPGVRPCPLPSDALGSVRAGLSAEVEAFAGGFHASATAAHRTNRPLCFSVHNRRVADAQ